MGDGFLAPFNRIARVVAQTLVAGCKLNAKVAQKRVHGDAIGQSDTELVGIFVQPGGQGNALTGRKLRADLLMCLEPFMRLGSHRR